ncbi:Bug family tripartite tricarboxylate transporter substrate binding protein [Roseomonas rosulenta]|uniref:Bug family tripartite tricarboxylate transporter substrate binding protein n=1 Tax=Roseomonas rosulenta TaxID=2748667 RepID=UPI0018DF84B8|nr:tripartite tricarboxylate transporter substrate binding protein [Roseomonas rosulenta]
MPSRRSLIAVLATLPGLARAQGAPLRIVFPFAPGGAADAVARMLVEQLGASLGRPAIVENRTGAGGRIGALAVRGAAPDGTTLLFAAGTQMVLQPHTDSAIGYDPVADFRPVAQVMRFGQVVAVGPDHPAQDIAGLLVWYRADPARRSFGSPGIGTGAHFAGLELGRLGGVALEHVAYRGTPAALPDLQSGRLPMFVASFAEFREHAAAGRVRLIATTDAERSAATRDIPTLREQGIDVVAPGWFALYAPAGTPDAVIARLAAAVAEAVGAGGLGARIAAMGFEPSGVGPEAVAAAQRDESARWAAMVRASGFRPA